MMAFAAIPLLQDIPADIAHRHAEAMRVIEAQPGQLMLDFEDVSDDVFFVLSGAVRVQVRTVGGRELILSDILAGQIFGDMAAIDGAPRSASVTALQRARLARMGGTAFRRLLAEWPDLALRLMRVLVARIRDVNARMLEFSTLDVRHRLYAELLRAAGSARADGTRLISPPPMQHIIANRIGARREAVSREMARLLREGILLRRRGALVLCRPDVLEAALAGMLNR